MGRIKVRGRRKTEAHWALEITVSRPFSISVVCTLFTIFDENPDSILCSRIPPIDPKGIACHLRKMPVLLSSQFLFKTPFAIPALNDSATSNTHIPSPFTPPPRYLRQQSHIPQLLQRSHAARAHPLQTANRPVPIAIITFASLL